MSSVPAVESISLSIATLRGQRVIVDSDLAALYGVETKRLNEQVKRNEARFPADFMFQLAPEEAESLRSQFATLNAAGSKRGQHRKYSPYVFTEHGAIMAAMVLNSPRAVEMSVYVVRAFVRLREAALFNADLARRLSELEEKTEALAMSHDSFSHNTRVQMRRMMDALKELMAQPEEPKEPVQLPAPPKRPIGFITPEDKLELKSADAKAASSAKGTAKK